MFYRKYRPQQWGELDSIRIRESLGTAILNNEWSHAYLLVGKRGTGKTTTARLIAKTINCTDRKKGEEPCNKCNSCLSISGGSSMDVIEIDAASNTGVEDIRDLREKVKLAPSASKYKVYIIDEVHMLSNSAFNALLKTLEEPPAHVVFVLATTDPQKLPETIVSRCLVYDFGRAQQDEIISGLKKIAISENLKIEEIVLVRVAQISAGSHRDAAKILEQLAQQSAKIDLELLDSLNTPNFESQAKELFKLMVRGEKQGALKLIEEETASDETKVLVLTNSLLSLLQEVILSKEKSEISGKDLWLLMQKLIEAINLSKNCPVAQLPLEILVADWCDSHVIATPPAGVGKQSSNEEPEQIVYNDTFELIKEKWPEIVLATKPFNHSLMAVLKAGNPIKMTGHELVISVLYKFHKEKLEEAKNRDTLEKVISDIIGAPIKVKFELAKK